MTSLKFLDQLPKNLEEKMWSDLVSYESSHGIALNYKQFSLVLTNDNNEAVGVLSASTVFAEVRIAILWVHSLHRGKGYGGKLIDGLENHFKGKGFNNISLVTSQFQAPEFYKKCGFQLEFVRKNEQNPKLTKFFFVKFFDEEVQTQGIVSTP